MLYERKLHSSLQMREQYFVLVSRVYSITVYNIVTCSGCAWLIHGGLDWMIGFIDILYTPLGTTGNYSAIALSTLYSSLLHTH
jgi:hypothetical protein